MCVADSCFTLVIIFFFTQDHSGLEATLKEFVATLKCRLVKMNRGSVIEDKLRDFPERERRILQDLLT